MPHAVPPRRDYTRGQFARQIGGVAQLGECPLGVGQQETYDTSSEKGNTDDKK